MNALLNKSTLDYGAIDFSQFNETDFLPALKVAIEEAYQKVETIKQVKEVSFENVIEALEQASDRVDLVTEVFYVLYSAHCTDELSKISEEFSEEITRFGNNLTLDSELFAVVKKVYDQRQQLQLSAEQKTVLDQTYQDFVRNGALLSEEDKNKLRKIDENLAKLSLKFSENVRNATNDFVLLIDKQEDLKGMPASVVEAAKETAAQKGHEGFWCFTLEYPSYLPFMQYCQNRELRKKMHEAFGQRAFGGKFDNQQVILDTLKYRKERALLLGFKDHAEFVLQKRMAQNSETVMRFLEDLLQKAMPVAQGDLQELKDLKKELTGDDDFQKYDSAFYTEILMKRKLNIDDELLRPYFKLENVINGVFQVATKLYGLKFKERADLPKYHPDVKVYEVMESNGEYLGLFYADFFPRETRRPGAWMTDIKKQGLAFGKVERPHVSIVCNFTKPVGGRPSLLTLDEVLTLYHEFGHALHGLLTKCTYRSVSGTSVFWDFVELPSQIMENWVMEKECLDMFAVHYETGEKIPEEYIAKIKESRKFLEGLGTLRQLSFAFLDMAWHTADADKINNVGTFEYKLMDKYDLYPKNEKTNMSCSFGHLFSGGYAAGYYSYKWAEVLDADAFSYFQEEGIFSEAVAKKFKEHILEKGGSEHPMELYKRFRGKEPSVEPLLIRSGLVS